MDLTIYPLGDSAFIERVLNAVALYTGQDSFSVTVATAALLGVFAAGIQSILKNGKELDVASIFVGVGGFILLFGSLSVTVNMEDRTTGAFRTVDNVPAGVAIPAYLISNIGKNISEGFETIYTSVSSTNQNTMSAGGLYADSLQALVDIRDRAYSQKMFRGADAAMGGGSADFKKSLQNYLMECALVKYDLEQAPLSDLQMEPIQEAIRFENEIYHTRIFTSTGPEELNCSQAYALLTDAFAVMFDEPQVEEALNVAVRSTADLAGPDGFDWTDKMNNTSSELFSSLGSGGIAAQQMALTMIVEPVLLEAAQGKYDSFQDQSLATSMTNAIEQRNISWAAQRSFFQETIYPMMTFFEGLSFAITPFIAFLMVMGAFGIKLGIKYFMLLIWIQLWLPLMSIVDLFITEGAASEIAMLGSATGAGANSIYFMNEAYDAAKTWIGTGSYMATAVPMIAMFLVSGSMYGAASLASSISSNTAKGADQAAETVQPDAMSVGALSSASAGSSAQFGTGASLKAGREGEIPTVSFGSAASDSTRAAAQNLRSETDSFAGQYNSAISNTTSSQEMQRAGDSFSRAAQASRSDIYSTAQSEVSSIGEKYGQSEETSNAISGILAGSIGGQISTPNAVKLASAQIDADASIKDESKDAYKKELRETFENGTDTEFSDQEKADFGTSVASGYQYAQEDVYGTSEMSTEQAGLTYSSQQVESASESYENAQSFEQRFGMGREFNGAVLANQLDDQDYKELRQQLAGQEAGISAHQDNYEDAGLEPPQAARLATLTQALESDDADTRQMAYAAVNGVGNGPNVDQSDIGGQDTGGVDTSGVDPSAAQAGVEGMRSPENKATLETDKSPAFSSLVAAQGADNAIEIMEANASNKFEMANNAQDELISQIGNYGAESRDSFSAYSLTGLNDTGGAQWEDIKAASRAGDDAFIAMGENLASTTGEAADGYTGGLSEAWNAANGTEGSALDKMGAFLSTMGDRYGETTQELFNGVGDSFSQGIDAGMESYENQRQGIADSISADVQDRYGLTEEQGNFFAESQMSYLDQALGTPAGLENYQQARQDLMDAYAPEYGQDFANDMAGTIQLASANTDFAGGQLSTISAFNSADEMQETSRSMLDQLGNAQGAGAGSSPMSPEFIDTMDEINERLEDVSTTLESMGVSFGR